jgi:hypothetical protein
MPIIRNILLWNFVQVYMFYNYIYSTYNHLAPPMCKANRDTAVNKTVASLGVYSGLGDW